MKTWIITLFLFTFPATAWANPPCPQSGTSLSAFRNCLVPLANGTGMALRQQPMSNLTNIEPTMWYPRPLLPGQIVPAYPYAYVAGNIASATLSAYASRYNYGWFPYGWAVVY